MSNNDILENVGNAGSVECNIKTPKRVLHFSDGVLEEFSNDEDIDEKDSVQNISEHQLVLKRFPLISMITSSVFWFGSQTLRVCDYIGENLANFFGITSPKYQYEIDEYNRIIEEENDYKKKQLSDFSGWTQTDQNKLDLNCVDIKHKSNQIDIDLEKQKF